MLDCMIDRGQIGAYQASYDKALAEYAAADPVTMARNSGVAYDEAACVFLAESFGQRISIGYPGGKVRFAGTDARLLWTWGFLLLHHLTRADGAALGKGLIGFRETASGAFYFPSHEDKTVKPLEAFFSSRPAARIREACLALGAAECPGEGADVCARFTFAPRFPITFKLWLPDEEFGCSVNLLYDANANHYLHTEDVAVASGLLSRFLIAQYRSMFPAP